MSKKITFMAMKKIRWQIAQFFEKRWWQSYLSKKDSAAYLLWKKAYWLNFLKQINLSKEDFKDSIIDIGCGPAGIFMLFEQNKVLALDPLYKEYANGSMLDSSSYPWVEFVGQSFEAFIIKEKYQSIFCLNAINHFIDLEASAKKLYELSEQNARLVLSIDAHNFAFFKRLFRLLPLDILHPHQFDLEEYVQLMEKQGFRLEDKICLKKEFFFNYWVLILSK